MPLSRLRAYASTPPLHVAMSTFQSLIVVTLVEPMPSACEHEALNQSSRQAV